MPVLPFLLLLQQGPLVLSTPPSGDTVGYWQQRADYTISATLDESRSVLRAHGTLRYANNSPDTLRELYVHQYLNAFRPGSKWSQADEREGRVRFQHLRDPDYAYERFLQAPRVLMSGLAASEPVTPEYPGAPDSTVVRLPLPRPFPPGESLQVEFSWEARPSTLPRRQGRRGRSFDFAQWFPKVAVYDRRGWEQNPLVPAGEFYGEFGTFDVTLVVRADQVLGATGVPVDGDPGWLGAMRAGAPLLQADAYRDLPPAPPVDVPAGYKRVRWRARDVHHFAWSTSPDYRYEGGTYVRAAAPRPMGLPAWDTVAIHVLYRPGDEDSWGRLQVVDRTRFALRWLESVYGPYAYPQMTVLHRIEPGGTEFPMMQMNGSPSQGLILHEGGHVFSYGILANNEWQSGWMDEGLTSYQTSWAQKLTPQDQARAPSQPVKREGYAGRALRPTPTENQEIGVDRLALLDRAEPIGTRADRFSEFGIYNEMIYTRAEAMYGALRDAIGDSAFAAFLHDYYARWALKHVDELAMRASAERASGRDLGWFFDQWVHRTGVTDYVMLASRKVRADSGWVTRVHLRRKGEYRHAMPVGALTSSGWTIVRGDPMQDDQWVEIRTTERPRLVRLDPLHSSPDWDARNDWRFDWHDLFRRSEPPRLTRNVVDWPFLEQWDRERTVVAWSPIAWYSAEGGLALGVRSRASYQGWISKAEGGDVLVADPFSRAADDVLDVFRSGASQLWIRTSNPTLPWRRRPVIGLGFDGALLDGVGFVGLRKTWDQSRFLFARSPRASTWLGFTGAYVYNERLLPEPWLIAPVHFSEITVGGETQQVQRGATTYGVRAEFTGGATSGPHVGGAEAYGRVTLATTAVTSRRDGRDATFARIFVGFSSSAPYQRAIFVAADPVETFFNHWYRPHDAVLKQENVNYVPLGGAGMHGLDPLIATQGIAALNVEDNTTIATLPGGLRTLRLGFSLVADAGLLLHSGFELSNDWLADAGPALTLRGRVFDRPIRMRVDVPIYVSRPALAVGRPAADDRPTKLRYSFSFNDLW